MFKNWDTRHTIGAICALFALASLVLAFVAKDTGPLFHVTAGTFGIVSLTLFAYARQLGVDLPPPPVASATPPRIPLAMLCLVMLLGVMATGCLSSAPLVAVTPANQGQVAQCENTASLHNGIVVGDFVLGGTASGLASAAAGVGDQQTKTDIAIAAATVGGVLVVGTALAELTASNFTNSRCGDVVGALPTAAPPAQER